MIADSRLVAVIGPATSGAVAATSQAYFAAGVAHISPSATRTSLTKGAAQEATSGVLPGRSGRLHPGPEDARYMIDKLNAKKVVLIDFQEPYSVGLADAAEAVLKAKGVATIRLSTSVQTTDFSSLVTRAPSDADIVFFPTQQPPDAQTFGQQLLEQGKKAKVFGGDGANSPAQFKLAGSYVSNFAPDISGHRDLEGAARRLEEGQPERDARVVRASDLPRRPGRAARGQGGVCARTTESLPNRRAVLRQVKQVRVPNWILGGTFRFSTKSNDPLNAKFYIFQIQSERHVQARRLVGADGTTVGAARPTPGRSSARTTE